MNTECSACRFYPMFRVKPERSGRQLMCTTHFVEYCVRAPLGKIGTVQKIGSGTNNQS